MTTPLLFVASFMFLASLLLLGVIYSRIHWIAKALLVASSLVFAGFFYTAYIASLGYPTVAEPPEIFRFISSVTRDPAKDDPGAIYIWLMTLTNNMPRAIAVPFSTENRRMMAAAKKRTANGEIVYMGTKKSKSPRTADSGARAGNNDKSSSGNNMLPYIAEGIGLEIKPSPDTVPKKEQNNE